MATSSEYNESVKEQMGITGDDYDNEFEPMTDDELDALAARLAAEEAAEWDMLYAQRKGGY